MPHLYDAPIAWMKQAMDQAARDTGLDTLSHWQTSRDELAELVLEGAARFAGEVISPLNPIGDRSPSRIVAEGVVTPPGYREAYRQFQESGWGGLSAPAEFGGQELPLLLAGAATEMWAGASLAFAMCPEVEIGRA